LAGPLLPTWLPDHHPFYVSPATAERIQRGFRPNRIFLNIPYASRYSDLEVAVLSTATAYGLDPCMAKERSRLEVRMRKIVELMLTCQYGFTDLSYAGRMNMPFELGVLLAWGKETFVISAHPTRTIQALSDLNFGDIEFHRRRVKVLIEKFSRWIERTAVTKRLSSSTLLTRYRRWQTLRRSLGADFDRLTPAQLANLVGVAEDEFSLRFFDGKTSPKRTAGEGMGRRATMRSG
jgi:hypothetical protein